MGSWDRVGPGLVVLGKEGILPHFSNTGKSCFLGDFSSSLGLLKILLSSVPKTCPFHYPLGTPLAIGCLTLEQAQVYFLTARISLVE